MPTIKVGREGDQPFEIKTPLVSRIHAIVNIDEGNGEWSIVDCNSTNGTFLRDEVSGEMRRIEKANIHPLSFICLGANNTKGCTFYARQLLSPGNYDDEILYMRKKEKAYQEDLRKIEETGKMVRLLQTVLPVLLFAFLMIIWKDNGMISYVVRTACSAIPSTIIQIAYDPKKKQRILKDAINRFHTCPNPACNYELSYKDIMLADCPKCHCI